MWLRFKLHFCFRYPKKKDEYEEKRDRSRRREKHLQIVIACNVDF